MTTPPRLVLATNNRHKITEIQAILHNLPITLLTPDDFTNFPDPEETGSTLRENAEIKAVAVAQATGCWALADDSGLEIDALDGAPGVFSARYAGSDCSFADNNTKVLGLMAGVPAKRRTARFRCVAALARGSDIEFFEGSVEGIITDSVAGTDGFGYDPIFYVPQLGHTFAEATPDEKNRISHRGLAFQSAGRRIEELLRLNQSGT